MNLKNINGYLLSGLNFKEANENEQVKKVLATGLLCPKNKISRNGVMYDWDSIRETHDQIKGLKLMYNHETDGIDAIPIGHATKTWLKEEDDENGIAGLYYEADLDPEHPHTRKILRGDLDNVSLQINASEVIPKYDSEHGEYQLAKISDWLEFSIVPVSGYKDATIEARIAEAYKKEKQIKKFMENTGFPYETFKKGLEDEMNEHPDTSPLDAARLVLDHLKKDENYYDSSNHNDEDTKTEDMTTATNTGAYVPTIMSNGNNKKDKEEEEEMTKLVKKENQDFKDEEQVIVDTIKKEEYEDDMNDVTSVLERLTNKVESLEDEINEIRGNLVKTESTSTEVPTEADELTEELNEEEDEKKGEVVPDEKTETEVTNEVVTDEVVTDEVVTDEVVTDEDKLEEEEDDEKEDDEPIPPKLEKVRSEKIDRSFKTKKIETKKESMSLDDAMKGFVRDKLNLI